MNSTICNHCRTALRQQLRAIRTPQLRSVSSKASKPASAIAEILAKPSWSVWSLLPSSSSSSSTPEITPKTLHHLLRLSALPPPSSADEEAKMLATLESQLGFVRAVRDVDTTGVEPLRAIRDETAAGLREQAVGLEQLREALENEDVMGHARRPRRRRGLEQRDPSVEGWDVLAGASETAGRYFVVRAGSSTPVRAGVSQKGDAKKF
ncbi:hypothetical protein F5Y04DRAFT_183523 [Hypomontagnella monticulosa]|nr:hypothetical protein F5Y04DRAFT_183523 [Hypomontagnella monticulosa]